MTKAQLNKEYERIMLEANKAVGRKEAMGLFKRARQIKKKLYRDEFTYPPLNNDNMRINRSRAA